MRRPCFLVLDQEFPGNISTRKLIIETAKFNCITAYSAPELLETLERFPDIDGLVMDTSPQKIPADELVRRARAFKPSLPIVVVHTPGGSSCEDAEYHLDSFSPNLLLDVLQKIRPRESAAIEKHEKEMSNEKVELSKPE